MLINILCIKYANANKRKTAAKILYVMKWENFNVTTIKTRQQRGAINKNLEK